MTIKTVRNLHYFSDFLLIWSSIALILIQPRNLLVSILGCLMLVLSIKETVKDHNRFKRSQSL